MKNISVNHIRYLLVNRRILLLIALLIIGSYIPIDAQSKNVTIQTGNATLGQVISEIEKQTNYLFVYDNTDIDLKKAVYVQAKNEKIDKVLTDILKDTDITYTVENRNILLMKKSEKKIDQSDQAKSVRGTVRDAMGDPLIGVTVQEKGTQNGQTTDLEGRFTIQIKDNQAVLLFSYIGYNPMGKKVDSKGLMDIILQEDTKILDEVVVVGYMEQKKGLLTGSVATMNMNENLASIPTTAAGNLLAGKLAGVNVSTPKGIPGEAPTIKIRTESSWNDQNVLYVIDGVVRAAVDFNNLSSNEIDNVTVLKDAASAAVYGARSAGGVIVVTTKRGNIGKPTFSYSYGYSFDSRTANQEFTSAVETFELYNRINGTSSTANFWTKEDLDYLKTINNGYGYDHLKEAWVTPTTQNHNFSVNGGSEKVRYFAAAAYVKQQGFLDPMTYDRLNLRTNTTVDITKDIEAYVGFSLSNANSQSVDPEFNSEGTYQSLLSDNPATPYYTDGGRLLGSGSWNLMARTDGSGGYYKKEYLDPTFTASLTYKLPFMEGLSAKVLYGRSWNHEITKQFLTTYDLVTTRFIGSSTHIMSTDDNDISGSHKATWPSKDKIERKSKWGGFQQLNFQLNYNRTFGEVHNVAATLVSEWSESGGAGVTAGRETFPLYLTDQFWAASSTRNDTYGDGDTDWEEGRMSYIGQFGYTYANKYLLTFSFREDGSMKFAPNKRWGLFPAGSVGWVISEENFFNTSFVNFLKLRSSLGLTGNDSVGGWQWKSAYEQGKSAYLGFDPSKNAGVKYGSVVNPNLTWEKALTWNIAVDMNFAKHWGVALDYWNRNSYDILDDRKLTLPTTYSQKMPKENYGEMRAQGLDFSVNYNGKSKDFDYFAKLTMSYGWNKIVKKDYAENAQWIDIEQGKSKGYLKGYQYSGIIRTQEQLDAFNKVNPNYKIDGKSPELGMMVYDDLTGQDGVPDGVIDSWDRVMLRSNNFPIIYGLNVGGSWKGFSLDAMFSGRLREWKSFQDLQEGYEGHRMWKKWYTDSWTEDNPNAGLPKRMPSSQGKTYDKESTFWYKKADFVRLKYLTLSYNIPKSFYHGVLENVRLSFSGANLFVLSGFNHYDPEMDNGKKYPITRSFNFGVDVKF